MAARKRIRRVLVVVGLLVVVAGGLWATGWPQRIAFEWAAGRMLGAVVVVKGLTTVGAVRVDEARAYPTAKDRDADQPSIIVRDIELTYDPFTRGRVFPSVTVSEVELQTRVAAKGSEGNLEYFSSYLKPGSLQLPTRWVPQTITVNRVHGVIESVDGSFSFDGLGLEAKLDESGDIVGEARSNAFTGTWTGEGEPIELREGFFRVGTQRSSESMTITILAGLPGWLEAEGNLNIAEQDDRLNVQCGFDVCRVYGDRVAAIVSQVSPLDIEFALADFSESNVSIGFVDGRLRPPAGGVHGSVTGLRVRGAGGEIIVDSDANVSGILEDVGFGRGSLSITLRDEPPIQLKYAMDEAAGEVAIQSEFSRPEIALGDVVFAKPTLSADITLSDDLSKIVRGAISVDSPEGASGRVSGLSGTLNPLDVHGQLAGEIDLTAQAKELGAEDLYGGATFSGTVRAQENLLSGEFHATSKDIGYGDFALPYGETAATTGRWNYDLDKGLGSIEDLRATIDAGTSLASERVEIRTDPLESNGTLTISSDLQLAKNLEYVSDATGTLSGSVQFKYAGDALLADYSIESTGEQLTLPEGAAKLEQFTARMTGSYDEKLTGSGSVSAARLSIAGAIGTDVSGPARIENDILILPDLRGQALGGALAGDIRVALLEDKLPATIVLDLSDFDLVRLTDEVRPPKVKMTGTANGQATILYTAEGLKDFDVTAKSARGFTLNRDLVEEVLQQDSFRELFDSGPARKTLDKFLGPFDQRPFNSAELTMGLQDGRIRGQAVLLSEKTKDFNGLNLTVDLAIDSEALADVLRSLEEGQVLDIHR